MARGTGYVDYRLISRFWEDSDYNALTHRLLANGHYWFVPDWFYLRAAATYGDDIINPLRSYNYGSSGLFDRSNIAERATAEVTPTIDHDFRDFNLLASYTYGRVWYFDNNDTPNSPVFTYFKDDSRDQLANVRISTRDQERLATLAVFYQWQASDFETTVPYRYERLGTELGMRLTRELRLVGEAGAESDLNASTVAGGLDSTFWLLGLRWKPDSRTTIDARAGERFFGNAYSALIERQAQYVTVQLTYSEEPEVETRRVGVNYNPDDILLPDLDLGDASALTSFPYVAKNARAAVIAEGAKTKIRFELYNTKREFLTDVRADTNVSGVRFNVLRDLGSEFYAEFDTQYADSERGLYDVTIVDIENPIVGESRVVKSKDLWVKGRLTWEFYRNFFAAAEAGYLRRSGDLDYDGQWIAFRLRYTF
jgi:hypothetical protein